jgi:hypothetical protein
MDYVLFDPENGDLTVILPEEFQKYREELYGLLVELFLSKEVTSQTLERMNVFVHAWLTTR